MVAHWSVKALTGLVPQALAGSVDLDLDGRAVVFATIATAVTALLFGALPALQLSGRRTGSQDLRTTTSAGGDRHGARTRHALIVGEIAVTFVLVVAASLLVATLARLSGVDPGFRADHVLTADVPAPYPKYADSGRRIAFYRDVIARIRAIPGVAGVGLTSDLPFTSRGNYMSLRVEHQEGRGGLGQDALFRLVSAGYLETIGARLRAGRFLEERDAGDASPVVVINATLANQYWPGENALGHRIDTGTGDGAPLWMTIVGIVDDIKERGFDLGPKPAVYVPFTQTTIAFFVPSELAVRTVVAPQNLAAAMQRAVWTVDPEQPVSLIRTLDEIVEIELGDRHQTLTLLGALSALALALSAMGIYGVVSYLVSERRREIGIRLAIGATPGSIVLAMLGQGAVLAAIGIGVGVVAAFPTTRLLGSLLFGVSPVDGAVLGSVAGLMAVVTLAASYLPARRASTIDPMLVLRSD
jgi:predicted permease